MTPGSSIKAITLIGLPHFGQISGSTSHTFLIRKSVRAYYLKESFDAFWHYDSQQWARWFLKKWCERAMRSRLEPMKKFVRTLRNHEELLMNYFKAGKGYSSGIVEGLNLKINLGIRKAYGYRSFDIMKVALLHQLGDLPEPKFPHRFC